ncbi:MAG: carboxylate-amine ligase [Acidobacteria bacterium]|nr:carboxylate-amine ligase [Acidobacteriota bacterium]
MNFRQFTLGIEEEYQIIDPETRELRSHIETILDEGKVLLGERVKPELHQSVVEVGTRICADVQEARDDIRLLRQCIDQLSRKFGLRMVAAGTHPFSDWRTQEVTERNRYKEIVEDMQDVARANLIFGLHVHVGVEDRNVSIEIMNAARYFLPHILALTTSSPFWLGRPTGLKSSRASIFRKFPRTGIPDYFDSWSDFDNYIKLLIKTGCIDNGKKIWWDIRPHAYFPTLEFRIMDLTTRVDETICVAAICQAIIAKLYKLYCQNLGFRLYRRALIEENKWRALRYGLDGKLIDFGKKCEVDTRALMLELLEFIDDVVDVLGSRREIQYVHTILREGTSADRQLRVFEEKRDLKSVVDHLVEDTLNGVY